MKVADEICKNIVSFNKLQEKEQEGKKVADESEKNEQKGKNDWLKKAFANFLGDKKLKLDKLNYTTKKELRIKFIDLKSWNKESWKKIKKKGIEKSISELLKDMKKQDIKSYSYSYSDFVATLKKKIGRIETFRHKKKILKIIYPNIFIDEVIFNLWFEDALFVIPLTLLPFLLLGGGFAFFKEVREKIRKHLNEKDIQEKKLDSEMRRIALKDFVMKYILAFIIIFGLLYCFNPYGIGATKAYGFIKTEDPISADTVPVFLKLTKSPIKHVLAGFWGWYLYLLWYIFYKYYKRDVISTRIYSVLFRKSLFVIGIALILSVVTTEETLIPIFLIGFFPLSAFSILKEFGLRRFSNGAEPPISLAKLPGISRWEILRLEEEGQESIASLATADRANLKRVLPIRGKLIDLWINTAVLMTLVGARKYECLKEICLTAENFVEQFKDGHFRKFLMEKCSIHDPDEIAKLIKEKFDVRIKKIWGSNQST